LDAEGAADARAADSRVCLASILTRSKDELSSDALSMHGFERLAAKDYRLAYLPGLPPRSHPPAACLALASCARS